MNSSRYSIFANILAVLLLGIASVELTAGFSFSAPAATIIKTRDSYSITSSNVLPRRRTNLFILHLQENNNDQDQQVEETVPVGSEEYYKGFLSRSLGEEPVERVTGDTVLGPTFKFVGGFALIITALVVGFMASNGLL